MKLQKIAINDKITLAYQTIGDINGHNPLLIFLHEGLGSIAQWKNFPKNLCAELNLPGLVYERYGYGHSTALQEERKPDYLLTEAEYFLPQLITKLSYEDRKLILVGHSDGASIALLYAALFPKNVLAVVSIAAHVFNEQISVDSIHIIRAAYELGTNFKRSLEKYHFNHTDSTFYAFADTITSPLFTNWNIESYLPKIEAPVFVIQGKDDEYGTEKQVNSIYNKSPHPKNRSLILKNCGHSPHLTHQNPLINEIKTFMSSLEKEKKSTLVTNKEFL